MKFNTNLFLLVFIILFIEFCSLSLYALGGSLFKTFMNQHVTKLNKISALCVAILGISMFFT
ncbi:hypothetical protein C414_000210042 [Campylobacter jejuni subsp. jejuni 414]|nr:hypothetical protein C414_000210042 [Campylobacter jejuni subsp. jejuni 414]